MSLSLAIYDHTHDRTNFIWYVAYNLCWNKIECTFLWFIWFFGLFGVWYILSDIWKFKYTSRVMSIRLTVRRVLKRLGGSLRPLLWSMTLMSCSPLECPSSLNLRMGPNLTSTIESAKDSKITQKSGSPFRISQYQSPHKRKNNQQKNL